MTARREFPRAVRVAVIKRATRGGVVYCEACPAIAKRFQIDHVRADGLLGEPTIENAMLICEPCWQVKNPADAKSIAAAKRKEAAHLGARRPKQHMPSTPDALKSRERPQHEGRESLPPRRLYEDVR